MTIMFLNGVTSSGKSSLAKALQETLPGLWLTTGIDAAIGMAPQRLHHHPDSFYFDEDDDGHVRLNFGVEGKALLAAHRWAAVALARSGVNVILDEVLVTPDMQALWLDALKDSDVWFVGIHCDLDVLEQREIARGNRRLGQAKGQFKHVHNHMIYDIELDATNVPTQVLCDKIMEALTLEERPMAMARMVKAKLSA